MRTRKICLIHCPQRIFCFRSGFGQTGIEQLLEEAESENLAVDGVIADITNYEAPDLYNIVVIDSVQHMLQNDEICNAVFEKLSNAGCKAGFF